LLLLPAFQRRGIGSALLVPLKGRSRQCRLPI
jgi:ribosomal protein S18 acetylase RimI-like enzyme